MTQNLKIEVLTGDISIDGMVVTNLVTKEELSTAIVKKADLGTDGKIPTSQLPDNILNTAGVVDQVKTQLETSIKDAVDESNAYAESYTDNALSSKADLVSGKVPLEQLPAIDQYPQFGTSLTNLSTAIMKDVRARTDALEKTKADLGEDGKVLREQIPSYEKISGLPEQLEVMSTQTAAVSGELDEHKLQTADQIDTLKENIEANVQQLTNRQSHLMRTYATKELGVDANVGVKPGEYFYVRSTNEEEMLIEYQNVGGGAVATGKIYPSARVVVVDSIVDLLALPKGQRKEWMRYLVKGYHAGSDVGGGEFYWDDGSVGEHNGGTVISAGVSWDGSAESFKDFLNGVGDDGTIGAFKLRGTPTALNFGVSETLPDNGYVFYKVFQELDTISIPSGSSPYVIASMPNLAVNKTGPVSIFGDGATQIEVTSPESGFINITSGVSFTATGFALRGAATRTSAVATSGILCKAPKVCVKGTNISGFNINVFVSSSPGGKPDRFESDIIISGNRIGLAVYKDSTQTNGYGLLCNYAAKRILVSGNIFTGAERHSIYLSNGNVEHDMNCVIDGNIIDAPNSINSSIKIHGSGNISNNRIYQKGGYFLIDQGLAGASNVINITGNEITTENVVVLFGVGNFTHTKIQGNTIKVSGVGDVINTQAALIDKRRTLVINDNVVTGDFNTFSREAMSHDLTVRLSGNVIEGYKSALFYLVPFLDGGGNPIAPTGVTLHIENSSIKTEISLHQIVRRTEVFDLTGINFRFRNTEVYSAQGLFKDEMTGTSTVPAGATQSPNVNLRSVAEIDPYRSLLPLDEANVQITPLGDMGLATKFWAERVSMGSIRIHVDQAPGIAVRFARRVTFPGNY